MYFDHMIPKTAPTYIELAARPRFEKIANRVRNRMNLLESALILSGLSGEIFSAAIKPVFDQTDAAGNSILDSMDAEDIADAALLLSAGVLDVPARIEWPNCLTVVDTAFVSNKEWECIRMLGLGGSDSANIIDEGYGSAQEVFHSKVGTELIKETDRGMQFIFDFGHKVEPLVIDEFCRRSGATRVPETRMFAHKDYPFLTANIDQIVRLVDGKLAVFEAKTSATCSTTGL